MKSVFFLLVVSLMVACGTGSSVETADVSDIRSQFELADNNGEAFSLEESRDNYLLVNFWATWCRPCISELPSIVALRDSLTTEPIQFMLVTNETKEQTNNFLKNRKINIPGYHMPGAVEAFELVGFPTTLVINPKGEVVLKIEGAIEWNDPANVARIRNLMDSSQG